MPDVVVGDPGVAGEVRSAEVDSRHQQQELPDDDGDVLGDGIHAKSGRYLRYISAIFFGFSAKF